MTTGRCCPLLAVTAGEPAGIGPQIIHAAWQELRHNAHLAFFVAGDARHLQRTRKETPVKTISRPDEARSCFEEYLPVLDFPLPARPVAGKLDARNARWVTGLIETATLQALAGTVDGLVTCPIHKAALYKAGFEYQGHTDYLAAISERAGKPCQPVMMMSARGLRTIPITVHVPLARVPELINADDIFKQTMIVRKELKKWFAIADPAIAVTGLNPHAGEGGAMGVEETEIIRPAVDRLAAAGVNVTGPLAADTLFHEALRTSYDAIVCMYHDQALIPVKTLDFFGGVNTTLGLPFIRTSPDHGTALDLAGRDDVSAASLIAAIEQAAGMARRQVREASL